MTVFPKGLYTHTGKFIQKFSKVFTVMHTVLSTLAWIVCIFVFGPLWFLPTLIGWFFCLLVGTAAGILMYAWGTQIGNTEAIKNSLQSLNRTQKAPHTPVAPNKRNRPVLTGQKSDNRYVDTDYSDDIQKPSAKPEDTSKKRVCPFCLRQNDYNSIVCKECGKKLINSAPSNTESKYKICPLCGKRNSINRTRCIGCDTPLSEPDENAEKPLSDGSECPYCHAKIRGTAAFCLECGKYFN